METGQPPPARVREHRAELGGISVLTARGTVDTHNAGRFGEALAEHLAHSGRTGEHPLLDLTEAYLACADAVRALDGATAALAGSGRVLHVVQPRPHLRETLTAAALPGIRVHATPEAALHALAAAGRRGRRPAAPVSGPAAEGRGDGRPG